jgi:microcystin-dependent protein
MTGDIVFSGAASRTNSLACNGALVDRTTYATLFGVIGTTYGVGDGSTTFGLPDLQDRFPVGAGITMANGATGGSPNHTLSVAEIPPHNHDLNAETNSGSHRDPATNYLAKESQNKTSFYNPTNPTPCTLNSGSIGNTGGGAAFDIIPPYLGVNVFIET